MEVRAWITTGPVLPFLGMMVVVVVQVATMELSKEALAQGANKYVIIVYSNALASLVLLPSCFIFHRSDRTPISFSILLKFFLLALFGTCAQIFDYTGMQYSSPTIGTAMLNLIPAFTFTLAIIFRVEKVKWGSKSSIAKCLGTVVSISGAFVVTFYSGPVLFGRAPSTVPEPNPQLNTSQILWIIGALLLAAEAFMDAASFVLQTFILKKFTALLVIVFYLCLFTATLSAAVALFAVNDPSDWQLKLDMGLLAVLFTGTIGLAFRLTLSSWCIYQAGPFFCSMFKPTSIIFAAITDFIFLGEAFTLGCLIGAIILVAGFYAVMWGKSNEEEMASEDDDNESGSSESSTDKIPLLQNKDVEEV